MRLHPQTVMDTFARLTGIKFRIIAPDVQKQAMKFCEAEFTLEELETVIEWVKWQIKKGQGGYSEASLQWRVLFGRLGAGDEFATFQERLGLAQEARKRGWRPRLTSNQPSAPAAAVKGVGNAASAGAKKAETPISDEEYERIKAKNRQAHQQWLREMSGGAS